jgi:hypothetical protein
MTMMIHPEEPHDDFEKLADPCLAVMDRVDNVERVWYMYEWLRGVQASLSAVEPSCRRQYLTIIADDRAT